MTPAEANLHAIAATFCAPRVVRERCVVCVGLGQVPSEYRSEPASGAWAKCGACGGKGYIVRECTP